MDISIRTKRGLAWMVLSIIVLQINVGYSMGKSFGLEGEYSPIQSLAYIKNSMNNKLGGLPLMNYLPALFPIMIMLGAVPFFLIGVVLPFVPWVVLRVLGFVPWVLTIMALYELALGVLHAITNRGVPS